MREIKSWERRKRIIIRTNQYQEKVSEYFSIELNLNRSYEQAYSTTYNTQWLFFNYKSSTSDFAKELFKFLREEINISKFKRE